MSLLQGLFEEYVVALAAAALQLQWKPFGKTQRGSVQSTPFQHIHTAA